MTLFALDMDGKLKWKIAHDKSWTQSYTGSRSMPTVHGDRIYLVAGHGLIGGYLIENGFIYGNHERGVACLDLKTGQKKWFDKSVGKCSVTYADGMLYLFGENDGTVGLAAASPDGFKFTGHFSVVGESPSWAHPVVTGGRLYLRYDTNLYCFDVKEK